MTAITHVYNYTVRTQGQQDASQEYNWRDHIEVNQSCEIALDRIYRWHNQDDILALDLGQLVIRQQQNKNIFYAVIRDRINDESHVMATFKLIAGEDKSTEKTLIKETFETLLKDYHYRIGQLS